MLVTNPQLRVPLAELLNHPWMTRGFDGPPDLHLIQREPLRADELDRQVIRGMTGFEFGTEDEIERRLFTILKSEAYIQAVRYWETKRAWHGDWPQIWDGSLLNLLGVEWDGAGGQGEENKVEAASTPRKNKRFSFDFYRRNLFAPSTSPPSSPSPSQSQQSNPSLDISKKEPPNPTHGYHPLISMYYLAREKMERTHQRDEDLRNISSADDDSSLDTLVSQNPPHVPLQNDDGLRNTSTTILGDDSYSLIGSSSSSLDTIRPPIQQENPQLLPYPSSTTLQSNGSMYNASYMTSPSDDSFM